MSRGGPFGREVQHRILPPERLGDFRPALRRTTRHEFTVHLGKDKRQEYYEWHS
jgi:hypothetical protein